MRPSAIRLLFGYEEMPKHPEGTVDTMTLDQHVTVGGEYFDVLDGTYEIVPVAPGEVELRLWSTHRLSTHFNSYAALWTDFVMRQIQGNILQVVRDRAEAAV